MSEYIFTAPGRIEIGGNHTDHQHGIVLAAAINLKTKARVTMLPGPFIAIKSEGYEPFEIALTDLEKKPEEVNTSAGLVRGIASWYAGRGEALQGFAAEITSEVLPGSGLSSSAAFEVLIAEIINQTSCGGKYDKVQLAKIGQWAENNYFGKPCGLMDQMASSCGGAIRIDFGNAEPEIERIDYDFAGSGHTICIIDSRADHANLTGEYAAITKELHDVCECFGRSFLREIDEAEFYAKIEEVRGTAGDRAVKRAIHVYDENKRVVKEAMALKTGDFYSFLELVNASGYSSYHLLQNVIPEGGSETEGLAGALALVKKLLAGRGAYRVHGGGFAGTALAFVPNDMLDVFKAGIEEKLGAGACHIISISPEGVAYEPKNRYEDAVWTEVKPGHFVLVNEDVKL